MGTKTSNPSTFKGLSENKSVLLDLREFSYLLSHIFFLINTLASVFLSRKMSWHHTVMLVQQSPGDSNPHGFLPSKLLRSRDLSPLIQGTELPCF